MEDGKLSIKIDCHKNKEGICVINVEGILDAHTTNRFKLDVDEHLRDNKQYLATGSELVLDLGEVNFMDASGYGVLAWLKNRLIVLNAEARLHVIISSSIARIFEIAQAHRFMGVYQSLPEAYSAIIGPMPQSSH